MEIAEEAPQPWGLAPSVQRVAAIDQVLRLRLAKSWPISLGWSWPDGGAFAARRGSSAAPQIRPGLALAVLPLLEARRRGGQIRS